MPHRHYGNKLFPVLRVKTWKGKKGISIIEILAALAIISIGLVGLLSLTNFALKVIGHTEKNIMAVNLASEMIEAVRSVRDESWSNISTLTMGADYHAVQVGVSPDWRWELSPGTESVDVVPYIRSVIFENVSRDVTGDIENVYNPLNDDPNTKKLIARVFWTEAGTPYQIEIITYITNWR